jgi:hypothetical protein
MNADIGKQAASQPNLALVQTVALRAPAAHRNVGQAKHRP